MDPFFLKRLWRRPWLSLSSLLMSIILCMLTGYLFEYRQEQQSQLEEAKSSYEILCVVTDRKGTKSSSLRMGAEYLEFVSREDSPLAPYTKDLRITKEFKYSAPEYGVSALNGTNFTPLLGVTNERCHDSLNPAMGGQVTYLENGFYDRTEYICIVSQGMYLGLEENKIILNVTDPIIDPKEEPLLGNGRIEFRVVGYYAGRGADILIPFGTALALSQELSCRLSCDSISFLASDNQNLTGISQAASRVFSSVDPLADDASGYALTILDEQYRSTVAVLEQNIRRAAYLVPVLVILGFGIGFLISFLSTRNENRTYALMRTMGMGRKKLFHSILREQMILPLTAGVAAVSVFKAWGPVLAYLLCYCVGCMICVKKNTAGPPTAILKEQE